MRRISRARWRWCISASRPTPTDLVAGASYRMIAHNGEINTLQRQRQLDGGERQASVAVGTLRQGHQPAVADLLRRPSDTACFDNALEFLVQGGYSLPHAVMMMIRRHGPAIP